jgi:hypothetical protein
VTQEERRRRFQDRMQSTSPEEREQFMQRMRERRAAAAGDGGDQGVRTPPAPASDRGSSNAFASGAQTIDQLFGPLPQTETAGRVWRYSNKQLKAARVRLESRTARGPSSSATSCSPEPISSPA